MLIRAAGLVLVAAALSACLSGCSEERVVLKTTAVYEDPPKGPIATLVMGDRVVVSLLPGTPDGFVKRTGGGFILERVGTPQRRAIRAWGS